VNLVNAAQNALWMTADFEAAQDDVGKNMECLVWKLQPGNGFVNLCGNAGKSWMA